MPLYDFKCPKCGLQFEVSRPMSRATEPVACPQDATRAERFFTTSIAFVRGGGVPSSEAGAGPSPFGADPGQGHGHSHGPVDFGHSH